MIRICLIGLCSCVAVTAAGCGRPAASAPVVDAEAASKIRATLATKSEASSGAAATQEVAKATGWGTIKGRFVYDGTPPTPPVLNITKDPEVCAKHQLTDEALLVDSKGGLSNVVLFARDRNIEVHPDLAAVPQGDVVLDNHDCRFEPHIAVLRAGQTLVVKNSDPVSHNTNAGLASNPAFNDSVPAGSKLEKKLTLAEQSPAVVSCTIHPWMKGFVVVQPHPYVAVSAKDGTFEIKNVPAGVPLTFQTWHEASASNSGAVNVNRPELKWQPNGRFTVTLQPDETLDLKDIMVPSSALAAR